MFVHCARIRAGLCFSLVPHEGIRRPSAPTGLAARPETLCGPRGGFWPHLSRTQLPLFTVRLPHAFLRFVWLVASSHGKPHGKPHALQNSNDVSPASPTGTADAKRSNDA